jgi:hypothetical protein
MPVAAFLRRLTASTLRWPIIACYINAKAAREGLRALLNIKAVENKRIKSFLRI